MRNNVPFLFLESSGGSGVGLRNELEIKRLVNGARAKRKPAAWIAPNVGALGVR
jgi:hypothetical protein